MLEETVNTTCVFTVIYPAAEAFLPTFVKSLVDQDKNDFDLLVINDGVRNAQDFFNHLGDQVKIVDFSSDKPAIRAFGFDLLKQSAYEHVIFADSDDFIAPNRVSNNIKLLSKYDLVCNELRVVNTEGAVLEEAYLSKRLRDGQLLTIEDIRNKNVLGLGNTAVRKQHLWKSEFPTDMLAVDWYFFSRMLVIGAKAVFTADTWSAYRQHAQNTVGFTRITEERITRAFEVQLKHYQLLASEDSFYLERQGNLRNTYDLYRGDKEFRKKYLKRITEILKFPLWWEEAKTIDELYED